MINFSLLTLIFLFSLSCKKQNISKSQTNNYSVKEEGIRAESSTFCPFFSIGLSFKNLVNSETDGVDAYGVSVSSLRLNKILNSSLKVEEYFSGFPLFMQGHSKNWITNYCFDEYLKQLEKGRLIKESLANVNKRARRKRSEILEVKILNKYQAMNEEEKEIFKSTVVTDYYYSIAHIKNIGLNYLEMIIRMSRYINLPVSQRELISPYIHTSKEWFDKLNNCSSDKSDLHEKELVNRTLFTLVGIHAEVLTNNINFENKIKSIAASHLVGSPWLAGKEMQKLLRPDRFYKNIKLLPLLSPQTLTPDWGLGRSSDSQSFAYAYTYEENGEQKSSYFDTPRKAYDFLLSFTKISNKKQSYSLDKIRVALKKDVEKSLKLLKKKYKLFLHHAELIYKGSFEDKNIYEHAKFLASLEKIDMSNLEYFRHFNQKIPKNNDESQLHKDFVNVTDSAKYRFEFFEIVEEKDKILEDYAFNVFMTLASGATSAWGAAATRALDTAIKAEKGVKSSLLIANASQKAIALNSLALGVDALWGAKDIIETINTCEKRLTRELNLYSEFNIESEAVCKGNFISIFYNNDKEKQFFGCMAELAMMLTFESLGNFPQFSELLNLRKTMIGGKAMY